VKKLVLPLLVFLAAAGAVCAQQDIKQEVAAYEKQIQDQLKGYVLRYEELTNDPGGNSIKNNLAVYKYRFSVIEKWITDEDTKLKGLENDKVTFTVYTSARYKALLNQYEALVREFEVWYKQVDPNAKSSG